MKSKIKLDIDYNSQPNLTLEVHRNDDDIRDKSLNKFMDEVNRRNFAEGFLINEDLLNPLNGCEGCCGISNSSLRGTFRFVPLSRKFKEPYELAEDNYLDNPIKYPTPDKETSMTTTFAWYYEILQRAENIKYKLELFNQNIEDVDYIIRLMEISTFNNEIFSYDIEDEYTDDCDPLDNQSKTCTNCGQDPDKENYYENDSPKKGFFDNRQILVPDDKKLVLEKLNDAKGLLKMFHCDLTGIDLVKNYIEQV